MAVIIRGAGDIATGIALRLHRAGFQIIMTDLPQPTSIRRTVCFSEALRLGEVLVEDVRARRTDSAREALDIAGAGEIAVVADPACALLPELYPAALVDAILAKRNLGTSRDMAPVVIGVGPGFTAGEDCHAAVETMRGHTLGRVLYRGTPIPNTGIPGIVGGYGLERVLRAPAAGVFEPKMEIGQMVKAGQVAALVGGVPMLCNPIPGLTETVGAAGAAECVDFADPEAVGRALKRIEENYDLYRRNALAFYRGTDNVPTVRRILQDAFSRTGRDPS